MCFRACVSAKVFLLVCVRVVQCVCVSPQEQQREREGCVTGARTETQSGRESERDTQRRGQKALLSFFAVTVQPCIRACVFVYASVCVGVSTCVFVPVLVRKSSCMSVFLLVCVRVVLCECVCVRVLSCVCACVR